MSNMSGVQKKCSKQAAAEKYTYVHERIDGRKYKVTGSSSILDCNRWNIIYLISCKKCGVQYVGKTSQVLRSRMNLR